MTAYRQTQSSNKTNFSRSSGFTLIEIMIAVAVVAILAAIAIPGYQDYLIRGRISEGVSMVTEPKLLMMDEIDTTTDLSAEADSWNAQAGGDGINTRYIDSMTIARTTGEITVVFNRANVGDIPANASLVFTPYMEEPDGTLTQLGTALGANKTGIILWGCSSTTQSTSSGRGLTPLTAATLPAKFAPHECR